MTLPRFGWPPGWRNRGVKVFLSYDGSSDTIIARTPNVNGVTKVGVGIYDMSATIYGTPFVAGASVFVSTSTGVPHVVASSQIVSVVPPVIVYRWRVVDLVSAPTDAVLVVELFEVPASFIG